MQLLPSVSGAVGFALPLELGGVVFVPQLPLEFWVLAALAVVADAWSLPARVVSRQFPTIFLSVCFTFVIALLWGAVPAVVVQTVALGVAAVRLRFPLWWLVFNVVRLGAALGAARIVLNNFVPPWLDATSWANHLRMLTLVVAAAVWFAVSCAILILELRVRGHLGWRAAARRTFGQELVATGVLLLLAPMFVRPPTGWAILFVLVPLFAVSQLARMSAEREKDLRHDTLTGLLSLRGFTTELDALVTRKASSGGRRSRGRGALLLLDLDGFKAVNDSLGHAAGDRLLVEVANRLESIVRSDDQVGRLGGDEFAVLAPGVTGAEAQSLARRVGDALAKPARVDGLPLDVSASIGVSLYPEHGASGGVLLRQADTAMYQAKRTSEAVALYSPHSDGNSPERLSLLADLRGALLDPDRRAEIQYHYQPQIDIATGELVGMEALLRWHHPTRGLVEPGEVIRVAEHSDVMQMLTSKVVDEVVDQLAEWNAAGLRTRVSINVSVRDLHSMALVDHLAARLRSTEVAPEQIEVEITETAFMADSRLVLSTVRPLADLGVGLVLDDLGTGFSSLQHLRQLPLAEVKVDRSFVQTMASNHDDEAIVRSVIELAHALGLRVVAEGVENDTIRQMLADLGCDVGQGWHYAAAMPADELQDWLVTHAARHPARNPTAPPALDRPAIRTTWELQPLASVNREVS